jgi:phosphatidylglycerol---prolipoprotein diacylglyceryl transferase
VNTELGSDPRGWLYGVIVVLGLVIGAVLWIRRWRDQAGTFPIYAGGLIGAFAGAKILYLLAEGWIGWGEPTWLGRVLAGKTIVGALLGGYAGVELAKKIIRHREATGDWFALAVPASIAMGRIGCLYAGCCLGAVCTPDHWAALTDASGVPRWPSVPLELIFQLAFIASVYPLAKRHAGRGQLFHLYLVTYGMFRFWHEFHRATPELWWGLSGYQFGALALVVLGVVRGWQRWKENRRLVSLEVA